ncbi:MAG TPA: DUF1287 domain-containing protein, partial [Steroidobacteraceae bacterium]|nr:DUF1287 domain-containing protein [Steroidobacteraceae bacterium]
VRQTIYRRMLCGVTLSLATGGVVANNLDLVAAARQQVGVTVVYDGGYRVLAYPGGDVPPERGVCTDVIVRAMRTARNADLQKLVHEDMSTHFRDYPNRWGLTRPDANIDHRRVPNLMTYFERAGHAQPLSGAAADYLPGDLVAWDLGGGVLHIGLVSDRKAATGVPLVIHNIGAGAREEDILFRYAIIGHYRLEAPR